MVKRFIKERLGTIIFFAIVCLFVVWGVARIDKARQNAITYDDNYEEPEATADLLQEGKYVSVAKTDSLELFYNDTKGTIQVKNLKNGYVWKSIVDKDVYDVDSLNNYWTKYVQSAITITYNDLKRKDAVAKNLFSCGDCKSLTTEYITNGVSVTYGFTTPGIYVTIEYILDGDQLVVRIPKDKNRKENSERSRYALTTIEVMPFFGASMDNDDGYLFYPDGSGAVTTFAKVDTRPSNVVGAFYYTYSHRTVTYTNLFSSDDYAKYTLSMPVYGIKTDKDNALFAAATDGEENTGLAVYSSGTVLNLNRMGFLVYTRNIFDAAANSISNGSGMSNAGRIQRVDKERIDEDKEIRYFFLNGSNATYSGMAAAYREYLLEKGELKPTENSGMALALKVLMGTTKEGMVFDEYISMTDYAQVQEMLDRLSTAGVDNVEMVLRAWQEGYAYSEYWGPASQLGGKNGLKNLNTYLESHPEFNVYQEIDTTGVTSKTRGLQEDVDVVYNGLDVQVAAEDFDGMNYYILNPGKAFERNSKLLSNLKNYGRISVGYETAGKYVYPDYNINDTYTKAQTADKIREMFAETSASGRKVAVRGSNQYVYANADYLYDLREESYGLNITDYSVPFVQMVLSGLIPYSTEGEGNLSYDLQVQKLKWIEYGALPSFYLTYESALNLRDTGFSTLFSSTYADWEDIVVSTYQEFKNNLSDIYGQQMVEHTILTDDLIRLTYADGSKVYINYGSTEASRDGVRVPAKGYLVVGR